MESIPAPQRLRVLTLHPSGMVGGAEIYQLLLAEATDRVQWDAVILAPGRLAARWNSVRGSNAHVLPTGTGFGEVSRAAASMIGTVRRLRPDVVVAHGVKAGLIAVPARLGLGIPTVWVRHDDSFAYTWARLLGRLLTGEISTSKRVSVFGRSRRRVVVEPPRPSPTARSAVDPPNTLPGQGSDVSARLVKSTLVLGMGGRLVPEKGFEDAIRAIALSAADERTWELAIFGIDDPAHPEERARLHALVRELGVDERVSIHAAVDDFPSRVYGFDALAVLTRTTRGSDRTAEWFGMVALEAMAAGIPVVCVESVGAWVGEGGLVVAASDPSDVDRALRALEDRELRSRIGRAGLRATADRLDAAGAADLFVDYLATVVHRPGIGVAGTAPLSVVVTVRDEAATIAVLLRAVTDQMRSDDEFVVVDGGSLDGTWECLVDAASRDERVRPLRVEGAGISAGRNRGIAAALNEHIVCTDAGCVPGAGWLEAFRSAIAQHPEDGLWTGVYDVSATGAFQRALRAVGYPDPRELAVSTPWSALYGRILGRVFDPARPTGRSVAMTRGVWDRVGGFREDLQTGEDVLFGQQAVASGATPRLVRDAVVRWDQRPTLRENVRMYYRYGLGSGASRRASLLGRDLLRAFAYPLGIAAALSGNRVVRVGALAAATAYLSQPMRRVLRERGGIGTMALVPAVAAGRDLSKAIGAVAGLTGQRA